MALSAEDAAFVRDLFDGLGPVTTRRMFGGLGLYLDGAIFAVMRSDGAILLKGVGAMAERFEAEGWAHWTYQRPGRRAAAMPYWQMPEALLDDPEAACDWARDAVAAL